jgi:hypothetical protein
VKRTPHAATTAAIALALVLAGCGDKSPTAQAANAFMGCTVRSHSIGGTVNGTLTSTCNIEGDYYDVYEFRLTQPRTVTIALGSTAFDAYLVLLERTGADTANYIADDDDGGVGYNSLLTQTLQAGTYLILVTSFSGTATGAYTLNTSSQ